MEEEDLLMNSIPNSSNLLRTYTARNLNWNWSIEEHIPLYLNSKSPLEILFLYISSLTKEINFRMLHLSSNIPSSIFFGSFYWELLRIARCILFFSDFTPKASELCNRTEDLLYICFYIGRWKLASSAGKPKQTLDCIDFIPERVV